MNKWNHKEKMKKVINGMKKNLNVLFSNLNKGKKKKAKAGPFDPLSLSTYGECVITPDVLCIPYGLNFSTHI